jgi:hypothetical protein
MKRKSPVELCLVDTESEEWSLFTRTSKIYNQRLPLHSKSVFTTDVPGSVVLSPRPCTPSPPMSPVMIMRNEPPRSAPKSSLRQSKRNLVAKYRDRVDLVEPQRDVSFASDYEILLFSHMIMATGPSPCFRCRLCPRGSSSTFSCKTAVDLINVVPDVEQHLLECDASPTWLRLEIPKAKARRILQTSPRMSYTFMIWKRVLAHALCSGIQFTTRVKFAEKLYHERIIPAREGKRN